MVRSSVQRSGSRRLVGAAAAAGLIVALAGCSAASTGTAPVESSRTTEADAEFQRSLDSLVDIGFPAAIGTRTGDDGARVDLASGVADLESGRAADADERVRVASNTKMFTAVVVMQLVDEGLLELDDPIEAHLPQLVQGEGIDGAQISVRQLLQHTSGLPEYIADLLSTEDGLSRYSSPRDLLDLALAAPADFAPGERWQYSNTNYVVLGLLIERITGNPIEIEFDERIIEPLDLVDTVMPRGGDRELGGDHPIGYHVAPDVTELVDSTRLDPAASWAAGGLVSTPAELNTFMQALFDGDLTSAESLELMLTTVPAEDDVWPGSTYGLGVQSYPLSCGGVAWGHGGDIPGYQTRNAVNDDGVAVTIAVTALPWAFIDPSDEAALLDGYRVVFQALDDALCAS
jgi:D-alanyl-D-alanine carboxypeptidase